MPNNARHCGFTLIELIVAITIGVLMTTAAYRALTSAVQSVVQVREVTDQLHAVDRVFQWLSADFNHAVNRPWADVYGQQQPAFTGLFGDRLSQSSAVITGADDSIIRLVRSGWDNPLERQRSHLQLVGYRLTQDENNLGKKVLWRDYWAVVDTADAPVAKQRRLLSNIEELQLRFLPADADSLNDNNWITGWPPTGKNNMPLPLAVEVVLTVENRGEITRIFTFAQTP